MAEQDDEGNKITDITSLYNICVYMGNICAIYIHTYYIWYITYIESAVSKMWSSNPWGFLRAFQGGLR